MNGAVEQGSPAALLIHEPFATDHAAANQPPEDFRSEFPPNIRPRKRAPVGIEPPALSDHQQALGPGGSFVHLLAFGDVHRHRLFHQHRASRAQGIKNDPLVQMSRNDDDHGIHPAIRQQILMPLINRCIACKLAERTACIGRRIGSGNDLAISMREKCLDLRQSHAAQTDNSQTDHGRQRSDSPSPMQRPTSADSAEAPICRHNRHNR